MANIYEIKEEKARKMLDVSLKYDSFEYFVLGIGGYSVTVKDIDGSDVKSPGLVMNAIYNKYFNAPEIEIDKKLYKILDETIDFTRDGSILLTILGNVEYQMLAEKEKRAPFTIDCPHLLKGIRENINRNYTLYKEPNNINKDGYIGEFKYHDQLLQESYNNKIL